MAKADANTLDEKQKQNLDDILGRQELQRLEFKEAFNEFDKVGADKLPTMLMVVIQGVHMVRDKFCC